MQRLTIIIFSAMLVFPSIVFAASFNCNKASRAQDKIICANVLLSQADSQLAEVYKQALQNVANKAIVKQTQINWLKTRDACEDVNCMLVAYQERIKELYQNNITTPEVAVNAKQNATGKYPVWISPDLGVKSLSAQDINAALARKFWDNPVYQSEFKEQLVYLQNNYKKQGLPTNCQDIIQLIKEGKYDFEGVVGTFSKNDTGADIINLYNPVYTPFLHRAETDCQAIRLLNRIKPALRSAVHDFKFNNKFAEFMPALVIPDDAACVANIDEQGNRLPLWFQKNQEQSWKQFYKYNDESTNGDYNLQYLIINPYKLDLKFVVGDGKIHPFYVFGKTSFRLLAKGNFTGEGIEELLVAMQFHRNFISSQVDENIFSTLFLLTRQKPTDVLKVLYPSNYMFNLKNKLQCDEKLFSMTDKIT